MCAKAMVNIATNVARNVSKKVSWPWAGGGYVPPLPDLFDYSTRSGLNLVDALGGSNALVLGGNVARFNQNNIEVPAFSIGDGQSLIFSIKPSNFGVGVIRTLFGGTVSGVSSIELHGGSTSRINIIVEGVSKAFTFSTAFSATIYTKLTLARTGNSFTLTRSDTMQQVSQTYANLDLFLINHIGSNFVGSVSTSFVGDMASVICATACYYLNNSYNSVTGVLATNSGVTFPLVTDYTPQSTTDALTEGYYQLSTGEQIPAPQFTLPVGAVNHEGGQVHNLINSYISIPWMDRSVAAGKFNSACRDSVYYRADQPTWWHSSELTYDQLNAWLIVPNTIFPAYETGYSNKLYLSRLMGFTTPLTGQDLTYYLTLIKYTV